MLHKLISLSLPLLLLGIFPTALAKIENIVFPTTATAGQTIQAQVSNYNFIQNFDDFDIIFSLRVRVVDASADGTAYAGIIPLTGQNPFLIDVRIPEWTTSSDYVLIAAVSYLVGASGITDIHYWSGNITITGSGSY